MRRIPHERPTFIRLGPLERFIIQWLHDYQQNPHNRNKYWGHIYGVKNKRLTNAYKGWSWQHNHRSWRYELVDRDGNPVTTEQRASARAATCRALKTLRQKGYVARHGHKTYLLTLDPDSETTNQSRLLLPPRAMWRGEKKHYNWLRVGETCHCKRGPLFYFHVNDGTKVPPLTSQVNEVPKGNVLTQQVNDFMKANTLTPKVNLGEMSLTLTPREKETTQLYK